MKSKSRLTLRTLTSQTRRLVLVDHQVGLMTGVRDYSTGELKYNQCGRTGQSGESVKLPIVVTTTARESMWGPTFPELVEAVSGIEIIDRSSVNAFDDTRAARAIQATKRKEADFRRYLARSLRSFSGDHSRG